MIEGPELQEVVGSHFLIGLNKSNNIISTEKC